jgi:hypothetical protein
MVSSGALNDIGAAYGTNTVAAAQKTKTSAQDSGFSDLMRNATAQEKTAAAAAASTEPISFSAGADIQKLGIMSQMKKPDLSADIFFSDDFEDNMEEELDSAISFDEIEELDRITDIDAAGLSANSDMLIFPEM